MNANVILNVQSSVKNELIPEIDKRDYFHLKNPHSSRTQLFDFAIALGHSTTTPLTSKADHTRGNYVTNSEYMYRSLLFNKDGESHLDDEPSVCDMAEQYANTGFGVLKDYMEKYDDSQLLKKLLIEMDKEFETIEPDVLKMLNI